MLTPELAHDFNRALKLMEKGKNVEANRLYDRLLKSCGPVKEIYVNKGNCLRALDRDEEAFNTYIKAVDPLVKNMELGRVTVDLALTNIGLLVSDLGDDDLAISYYKAALELNPLNYNAIWNMSLCYLRKWCNFEDVDIDMAWKMYEYRFKKPSPTQITQNVPLWDRKSKVDKIVVLAEQGLGDKLMWSRYLSGLEKYGQVIVQCDSRVATWYDYETCIEPPLGAVGIPICSTAFLPAKPDWLQGRFTSNNFGMPIVQWSGSLTHVNARHRNCPAHFFNDFNAVTFGDGSKRIKSLGLPDWPTTAAYVLSAPYVVTVDTSLAHLAGSLGVKTYVLLPAKGVDFRWGTTTTENRWYPSVKTVRNPGSWEACFENLKRMMHADGITI